MNTRVLLIAAIVIVATAAVVRAEHIPEPSEGLIELESRTSLLFDVVWL